MNQVVQPSGWHSGCEMLIWNLLWAQTRTVFPAKCLLHSAFCPWARARFVFFSSMASFLLEENKKYYLKQNVHPYSSISCCEGRQKTYESLDWAGEKQEAHRSDSQHDESEPRHRPWTDSTSFSQGLFAFLNKKQVSSIKTKWNVEMRIDFIR